MPVFLGSGLLFLASLFAATAVAGGLVTSYDTAPPGADVWSFGRAATYAALNVYAVKMAGVFMISTATISWRTGVLPRWLAVLGVVLAVGLLLVGGSAELASLLFPAWVLLVSLVLLIVTRSAVSDA